MRTKLRVAALLLGVVVIAIWFFGGPNLGWTKNYVDRIEKDPVTEIEVARPEKRWVPGVDFLGAGLLVSAVVAGSSLFMKRPK